MSTMKEKMHTGDLYLPNDETIAAEQQHCLKLLYDFNQTRPSEAKKRAELIKKMFAEVAKAVTSNCFTPAEAEGRCVYCSHCHQCPKGLDIAMINKYYDLAKAGDQLARDHYRKLELHAGDCIRCGHCSHRCPFHVDQMTRMEEIREYFGK